jgi:hypothetical protein
MPKMITETNSSCTRKRGEAAAKPISASTASKRTSNIRPPRML